MEQLPTYLTNDLSKFVNFDSDFVPSKHTVELADGRKESFAERKGIIHIKIKDEVGENQDLFLKDVLYTPTFPQNIFSVKKATKEDQGAKVELSCNEGILTASNGTKFPICSHGGLYYLLNYKDGKTDEEEGNADVVKSCKPSNVRSSTLEEWHKVLGHANEVDILKLEQVVDDMKVTGKKTTKICCETCPLSKQVVHRSRQPDERATTPLEFIHSDIAGPITPTAREGYKYVINFVDDYTGACFIYFLKLKSASSKALEKFLCDVAPYGKVNYVITRFRSDNGGEYISNEFETVLIKNKIRHEFSAPHSPHQNGTAERNWRSLFEMARSMIIGSGVPKSLWAYAVMAAAHVRNRMYSERLSFDDREETINQQTTYFWFNMFCIQSQ